MLKQSKEKIIGIFTSFYAIDSAYSLCAVVLDQLKVLIKMGYKTVLFVLPSFKDEHLVPKGVEIRKIIPQIILEPYKELNYPDTWREDVDKVKDMIKKNMNDITHLICHDIFFIDTYLPYNIALREAELDCKIFAWTHSAPSIRPQLTNNIHANRYTLPKNTTLITLNHENITALAEMYGAWDKDVKVIHNSRDPRTFWNLDEFVIDLIDKYRLLEKDLISVYPLSTPRMVSGKGADKIVKIHSELKQQGYKTVLILCNGHANGKKEKEQIIQFKSWALERGIDENDLIFTSLEDAPNNESGVSPKIVSDLFRLANLFIFPTVSENCSLVLLETMMSSNLCVLNKNVLSLREFGGNNALYFDFTERVGDTEADKNYWSDLAKIIANQFENNKVLQTKKDIFQNYNYDEIGKQIELLFY